MQVGHVLRHHHALHVVPRTAADAVARIHRAGALRAEIGAPGLAGHACGLGEGGAVGIGPGDAAEIAALAGIGAGDEEAHGAILRQRAGCGENEGRCSNGSQGHPWFLRFA